LERVGIDTPEVLTTLKPRKCTSLRCAPARGAAEAERRQGPASGLSWELGAAGHTSVTLSRPQTRAARERGARDARQTCYPVQQGGT